MFIYMVLALHIVIGNTLSEPTCSKFHYEEQTLESVVRLEFEMEKYKSALEDVQKLANNILLKDDEYQQNHTDYIKDRIDEKLEDLEKRWEGRLQQVETEIDRGKELQQNHTEKVDAKLEDMENRLEGRLQNLKTEIDQAKESQQNYTDYIRDSIDEKLTDMEKRWEGRLQNIKTEIGVPKAISYTATHPSTRNPKNGETIIFTRKMHDTAQAYDIGSGKFKAPFAGTYLFNVQLCLEYRKSYIHYSIIAGSRELTQTLLYDVDKRFCNSATAIARLAQHEYVYVKVTAAYTNSLRYESGERCHFSGVMLNTI